MPFMPAKQFMQSWHCGTKPVLVYGAAISGGAIGSGAGPK